MAAATTPDGAASPAPSFLSAMSASNPAAEPGGLFDGLVASPPILESTATAETLNLAAHPAEEAKNSAETSNSPNAAHSGSLKNVWDFDSIASPPLENIIDDHAGISAPGGSAFVGAATAVTPLDVESTAAAAPTADTLEELQFPVHDPVMNNVLPPNEPRETSPAMADVDVVALDPFLKQTFPDSPLFNGPLADERAKQISKTPLPVSTTDLIELSPRHPATEPPTVSRDYSPSGESLLAEAAQILDSTAPPVVPTGCAAPSVEVASPVAHSSPESAQPDVLEMSESTDLLCSVKPPPAASATAAAPYHADVKMSTASVDVMDVAAFVGGCAPAAVVPLNCPTLQRALETQCSSVGSSERPSATGKDVMLEDADKKTIFVLHNGVCSPISWYSDLSNEDVREMILCGCDAIIDSGFLLREIGESNAEPKKDKVFECTVSSLVFRYTKGKRYEFEEFHELKSGGTFVLERASERLDLRPVTGDRLRRFTVRIPPLQHAEVRHALDAMQHGANLLRHTAEGCPHLRQFQLSSDRRRILLYSNVPTEQFSLPVNAIKELVVGQETQLFKRYPLPRLKHLSFSILYDPALLRSGLLLRMMSQLEGSVSSLDLTCKSVREFDLWVTGLKALLCAAHGMQISKLELLGHSAEFQRLVNEMSGAATNAEKKETGPEFDQVVSLPLHSLRELEHKMTRLNEVRARLCERAEAFEIEYDLSEAVAQTRLNSISEKAEDWRMDGGLGDRYEGKATPSSPGSSVFADKSEEEDDLLEYVRMKGILRGLDSMIVEAQKHINEYRTANPTAVASRQGLTAAQEEVLREINQQLWAAEVEGENADDMLTRLNDRRQRGGKVFHKISQKFTAIGAEVKEELQKIQTAFNVLFQQRGSVDITPPPPTSSPTLERRA